MNRMICHFSGDVQGVGFRYTVERIARRFNVGGYVKNLTDGRVELVMEGQDDQMQGMLDEISAQMSEYIGKVDRQTLPASNEFRGFSIRH